ncbi:cyclin-dependent kinase inhibitor 1 isoform X3 [Osmerus mordax]|uniref:cyclin-dependent kinase inhibitor 1 isoform X3 n=1 Tax=Osmerus mordax TaxID=8014 RepID=UPI003510A044
MCKTMASRKSILSSLGSGTAQRSLFGPVDHEQLQQEYQQALRKDLEDTSRRWGFDFLLEKPLKGGDFQWEGVPSTTVPLIYRPNMVGMNKVEGQRGVVSYIEARAGPSLSGKENVLYTPERDAATIVQNLETTPGRGERERLKRKQTNITDFYAAKRRVVGTPRKSGQ